MEGMKSIAGGFFDEEAAVSALGGAGIALRDGLRRLRSQYGSRWNTELDSISSAARLIDKSIWLHMNRQVEQERLSTDK